MAVAKPTPSTDPASNRSSGSRLKATTLLIMAIVILVPSMAGFVAKFVEFIHTFQGEADGAFAITPMLNYLLASVGFFCMLVWAIANGMFYDMELPKHRMLEIEAELDKRDKKYVGS